MFAVHEVCGYVDREDEDFLQGLVDLRRSKTVLV